MKTTCENRKDRRAEQLYRYGKSQLGKGYWLKCVKVDTKTTRKKGNDNPHSPNFMDKMTLLSYNIKTGNGKGYLDRGEIEMKKFKLLGFAIIALFLVACDDVNEALDELEGVIVTPDEETVKEDSSGDDVLVAVANYTDPYSYLILVNQAFALEPDFSPSDLRLLDVLDYTGNLATDMYMRERAAKAVEALFQAALDESGSVLLVRSAYRSYEEQAHLYATSVQELGQEEADLWVARAGHSEHQTGLALDVSTIFHDDVEISFGDTLESIWLRDNAHRFGFIVSYPKGREEDTGFMYEPWHIRYVSVEVAREIYENNWIFEDFLKPWRQ